MAAVANLFRYSSDNVVWHAFYEVGDLYFQASGDGGLTWSPSVQWASPGILAGKQDAYEILTTLGELPYDVGFLYNDGTGVMAYGFPDHQTGLGNLQGGSATERYHLTFAQHTEAGYLLANSASAAAGIQNLSFEPLALKPTHQEGRLFYDEEDHTLAYYNDIAAVTHNIGQEFWARVHNASGATIPEGAPVYTTGGTSELPLVGLASAASESTARVLGIATHPIPDGTEGVVTKYGLIHNVNTLAYSVGPVYLGVTPGTLTSVRPTGANFITYLGDVLVSSATLGMIYVAPDSPNDLVRQNNATKEPTGFEDPSTVMITGDSATRTVTLTQVGGIAYWYKGNRYLITTPWTSDPHGTDTAMVYFLSFGPGGTFAWSTTPFDFSTDGMVATARYINGAWVYLRETHGMMQWQVHEELHANIGTYLRSGGNLTSGTYQVQPASPVTADNTPGVDQAIINDEDCPTTLPALPEGAYSTLRFVSSVATYDTASATPYRVGTNYPLINTGGISEAETTNNRFFNVWLLMIPVAGGTNNQLYRYLWMQPQNSYGTALEASLESFGTLNLGNLASAFAEFHVRLKLTFNTSASWNSASGRCRIDSVNYLAGTRATVSAAPGTAPGGPTGAIQYNNNGSFGGYTLGNSIVPTLGVLDTAQDIRTSASPTFSGLAASADVFFGGSGTIQGDTSQAGRGLFVQRDNINAQTTLLSVGTNRSASFEGQVAGGSFGALTPVPAGSAARFRSRFFDGTSWAIGAGFRFSASQDWTSTKHGCYITIESILHDTTTLFDVFKIDEYGLTTIYAGLKTGAPTGGTAQPWKLGNYTAGAATQAGKVRVEINGIAYDLLTA